MKTKKDPAIQSKIRSLQNAIHGYSILESHGVPYKTFADGVESEFGPDVDVDECAACVEVVDEDTIESDIAPGVTLVLIRAFGNWTVSTT